MVDPLLCTTFRWRPTGCIYSYDTPPKARASLEDIGRLDRLPTASLAAVLTIISGGFVKAIAKPAAPYFLISQKPIDPDRLHLALTCWERIVRTQRHLTPAVAPLADTLASLNPVPLDPAEHLIHLPAAIPTAPDWLFRAAEWDVATRLHDTLLNLDDTAVKLRMDSYGTLLGWDHPIGPPGRAATDRIEVHAITIPGCSDLLVSLDPHISQNATRLAVVDHVTVALPRTPTLIDLRVQHRQRDQGWTTDYSDYAGELVQACHLDTLPELAETTLTQYPNAIRGRARTRQRNYPVGAGVGPRYHHHLAMHGAACLDTDPLTLTAVARLPARPKKFDPIGLARNLRHGDRSGLKIVCLIDQLETSTRLTDAISHHFDISRQTDETDWEGHLDDATTVRVHIVHHPALLRPATTNARAKLITNLRPLLQSDRNEAIVAICETDSHAYPQHPQLDPKPQLRRLLASEGVPSQFLCCHSQTSPVDHPARAAIGDIIQSAGLLDSRYDKIVTELDVAPIGAWIIGLEWVHLRRPRSGSVLSIVAFRIPATTEPMPVTAFGFNVRAGWLPLEQAAARFHAGNLEGWGRPAGYTDQELIAIVHEAVSHCPRSATQPLILMAGSGRRIWPALTNAKLGVGLLPGDDPNGDLPDKVAVIRVTTNQAQLPNPAGRADANLDSRLTSTGMSTRLHRVDGDYPTPSWLFINRSRHSQRAYAPEAKLDRHTLAARGDNRRLAQDWHSLTTTELTVIRDAGLDPNRLAITTAILCNTPPAWEGRLQRPAVNHLAHRLLTEHPDWSGEE